MKLNAGIDVFTTMNIQHLESLNDVVHQITGIRVNETVPDRVFDRIRDIRLIDLPVSDDPIRIFTSAYRSDVNDYCMCIVWCKK